MDKASTQTTAVVTALEIMRSVQPWPDASPENVAAVILFKRGIRFRASVAPTLADILPPFRVDQCSKTGNLTVWQGSQHIPGTIGEPILKPSALKRAYTQAELDAAVMAERERWIGGARVSIPTDTMEQEIAAHVRRAVKAERERCIRVIEAYQVPVGNSAAGEIACEWTVDALREIRSSIRGD